MIISISGLPGAGKSHLASLLAKKLNWPRYYIGGLRRQMAKDKGMTLAEYNKLGETDPSTDLEVDEYQAELGRTKDNFIIEGRTSWHFIPQSIKIFLTVEPREGARRIFGQIQKNNSRNEDRGLAAVDDVLLSNQQRVASDRLRYAKYFGIDAYDESNYDLVIDTTDLTPGQVLDKALAYIEKRR